MKTILIAAILLIMVGSASAYPIPAQYRPLVTNDVDAYNLAQDHYSEIWAKDVLRQLEQNYTNSGRLGELVVKMEYLTDHEIKHRV